MTGRSPLRQPVGAPEGHVTPLLVDVVVLSADTALFEAIRAAVGERNPVWRARSAAESVDLLLSGRCGVLLLDLAAVSAEPASLVEQIVEQFPDVIVVVAGRREDEALLGQLLSDGRVYRFMHKPLSPKRAGMFLDAAMRGHVERRGLRAPQPSLLHAQARSGPALRKWAFVAGGLGSLLVLLALILGSRATPPETTTPATAPRSTIDTRVTGGPMADPVLSRARAAFASGRYEAPPGRNALDLYAAVLLARPGHPEARAGLARTVAAIVELADREAAAGRPAESRRLLQRVMAADPGDPAAVDLARRLAPAPVPLAPAATPDASTEKPAETSKEPPSVAARTADPAPAQAVAPRAAADEPVRATSTTRPESVAPGKAVPDPLTPRIVNADTLRKATRRPVGPRSYGAPIPSYHPVAGLAAPASESQASLDSTSAAPTVPAAEATAKNPDDPPQPATTPLPVGEFRPLLVVDPVYPAAALRSRTEGWVELEFTITESGSVRDVAVVGAEPRGTFETAASEALARWQFEPRIANGRPVPHRSVVTLRFNVDD